MIIKRIHATNFASWDNAIIDLPETGVVVVTGHNGAGKSTMIEVVAHAIFGKSVRGDWCWRDPPEDKSARRGWASEAYCETDSVRILRQRRSSGSPQLGTFDLLDASDTKSGPVWLPQSYDTTGKAQEAITSKVGSFSTWERCHVFSSHDAAHFTLASDKERKLLLESLLGLGYFDDARKRAATRSTEVDARVTQHANAVHLAEQAEAMHRRTVEQATAGLAVAAPQFDPLTAPTPPVLPPQPELPPKPPAPAAPPPVAPLEPLEADAPEPQEITAKRTACARVDAHLAAVHTDLNETRSAASETGRVLARLRLQLGQVANELAGWDEGTCPTCTQPVPDELREQLVGGTMARRAELQTATADAEQRAAMFGGQEQELREELDTLTAKRDELRQQVTTYEQGVQARHAQRAAIERQHADAVASREREHAAALRHHEAMYRSVCDNLMRGWQVECDRLTQTHERNVAEYDRAQRTQAEALRSHDAQIEHWTDQRDTAQQAADAAAQQVADAQAELDAAKVEQRRMVMVKEVLGPKGVRAHILGNAMAGLQQVANAWLARIGRPGQQVQLVESASALSLKLSSNRRPSWHNYKAASGGERRRVDVALILALAEVSRAAQGRARGTMFFDEVFDALDVSDGVPKVSEVIEELGSDRCVVVITHNPDLVKALTPTLALDVNEGVVR